MTADPENDSEFGEYASPACAMHEVDPAYMGLTPASIGDVGAWRKAERQRLIEARLAINAETRAVQAKAIAANLDRVIDTVAGKTISLYWPFRGEPDLRAWMDHVTAHGGTCLLPVVVEKKQPLIFRTWKSGERLARGVWNIPFPADGAEAIPDIVVAPLVGYDPACFRLGYGGGFYDRTLATLGKRQLVIGVGYTLQKVATIHPQSHDIPMDVIVTAETIVWRH